MRPIKAFLAIDLIRGGLAGLAGTAAGVGITMLVRLAMGLPAWNPGPVWVIGILVGVITYLAVLGVFSYWFRWAIGGEPDQESQNRMDPLFLREHRS